MPRIRITAILLILIAPLLTALLVNNTSDIVSSDLKDLMPEHEKNESVPADLIKSKVILASEKNPEILKKELEAIPGLTIFSSPDLKEFTFRYRFNLLEPSWKAGIPSVKHPEADESEDKSVNSQELKNLESRITDALFNPFASVTDLEISSDPFLAMRELINQYTIDPSYRTDEKGCIRTGGRGKDLCIITGEFVPGKISPSDFHRIIRELKLNDRSLVYTGEIFFADQAAESSRSDMLHIGIVSTVLCSILFILVFKSLLILLATVCSLCLAIAVGTGTVILIFGEIHIITLALGSCLIGICTDYNLHMFMKRTAGSSPEASRSQLRKPLLFSLISSASAYLIMSATDLCVLRQLAVMASATLAATYIIVMHVLPYISVKNTATGHAGEKIAGLLKYADPRLCTVLCTAIITAGATLYIYVPCDDDVGRMQEKNGNLAEMNRTLESLLNGSGAGTWYFLNADSTETALRKCEDIANLFEPRERKKIMLPCSFIPSEKKQKENIADYQRRAGDLRDIYQKFGIDIPMPDLGSQKTFKPYEHPLFRQLPIGDRGLLIRAAADDQKLISKLDSMEQAVRLDRRAEWSSIFRSYRIQLSGLLAISFFIMSLYMFIKAGRSALSFFVLPAGAGIASGIAANVLIGGGYMNMFTIMAGFMILGLGTDYSIFYHTFASSPENKGRTVQTLIIAWLTTEASFGMLALSDTNVIASFGLNLAVGLSVMLLAILLSKSDREKKETKQ
jgi:predicted exporter